MNLIYKIVLLSFLIYASIASSSAAVTPSAQRHLTVGNLDRTYLLYRPQALGLQQSVPLIIMLHGGFGLGQQAERSYNWDAEADAHGFIVAYPDGIGRSWNAGGTCCGPAARDHIDDIAFITQLIQTLATSDHIDLKRVYLVGMSNGSAMAYRYACEGSYQIAAIGSVSGSLAYTCQNPRPVSIIEIHGLNDKNIPFTGGAGTGIVTKVQWLPVQKVLNIFQQAGNCGEAKIYKNGLVETMLSDCLAGRKIKLIAIEGAGHQWPGSRERPHFVDKLLDIDPPSTALDATSTIWKFFQNQHI